MKTGIRRIISLCMVIMLVMLSAAASLNVYADEETSGKTEESTEEQMVTEMEDDGSMNLDVVFVLDGSGSMASSDPNKVALDAFNLFVDLCDETCSAGYTIFSERIKATKELTNFANSRSIKEVKEDLTSIAYDAYGDTDIALGLTKAMNMHKSFKAPEGNRKKAIILLSDGNTHLLNDKPRSAAESKKEMEGTLKTLKEMGIPVYSIGLNYDGTLDKKEVDNISKTTNGKSFETKSSDELPKIISDIFSSIYSIGGKELSILKGHIDIKVKDESVFYINVIIRTTLGLDKIKPQLKKPNGEEIDFTKENDKVKLTSTKSYTMLKLIDPDPGKWKLYIENATGDNCKITQLDFYSVYVSQRLKSESAVGEKYVLASYLSDSNGMVKDTDLLKAIKMTAYIQYEREQKYCAEVELTRKTDYTFMGEFVPEKKGEYFIFTKAESDTFTKKSPVSKLKVGIETKLSGADDIGNPEIELSEEEANRFRTVMTTILIIAVIALLIGSVIVAVVITSIKKAKEKLKYEMTKLQKAPDKPQYVPSEKTHRVAKPEKPIVQPAAKPPEYVDYELVEHDKLENLVKRGSDDAFNGKASDYQTDASLDAIIRKGSDDAFAAKPEDYRSDASLDAIIRKGSDDAFTAKPEDFQTDASLDALIRKGSDDAFEAKPEDYQTDASLDALIRKGTDDPFNAKAENYQVDPSMAGLIRTGGDELEGCKNPPPDEDPNGENGE